MAKKSAPSAERTESSPRTEAVTVRISPTAKWQLELLSRQMHMPISGTAEFCIEVAARLAEVPDAAGVSTSIARITNLYAFGLGPIARANALSHASPSLMSHEERAIVDALKRSPDLWRTEDIAEMREATPIDDPWRYYDREFLTDNYEAFLKIALESAISSQKDPITREQILSASAAEAPKKSGIRS